jgi:hypothetical protein
MSLSDPRPVILSDLDPIEDFPHWESAGGSGS